MTQAPQFSLLNAGISIDGDVILDHGVTCLGLISGDLRSSCGLLHIAPGGVVRGTVEGEHVLIEGTVDGDVAARMSLHILGRVKGTIRYAGTIRLGPDAALEGTISRIALPSSYSTDSARLQPEAPPTARASREALEPEAA